MDKQNSPYNFLALIQEFIKHFVKVLFVIKMKGICLIVIVSALFSRVKTKTDKAL